MSLNNNKPLLANQQGSKNTYETQNSLGTGQNINSNQNLINPYANEYRQSYSTQNGYLPIVYQPEKQGYLQNTQGYGPKMTYQPPVYHQPILQGYKPSSVVQCPPQSTLPNGQEQGFITLPSCITPSHPKYRFIVEQINLPCRICFCKGYDQVKMTAGCATVGWSACLLAFTGFCCWIPFVINKCKNIKITCNRCGHTKAVIKKQCC